MTEIEQLMRDLSRPGVALEVGVLLACLVVAYGLCYALGRKRISSTASTSDSIWFGRAVVDGVLFPLVALIFTYTARHVVDDYQRIVVLKVAVPILISLVGIRVLARVLTAVFPNSGLARLAERLFSWLAWAAAVLWIIGLLPSVMEEMDSIQFVFGKSKVSVLSLVEGLLSSGVVLVVALWISAALEKRILQEAVNDLSLRKVAANAIRAVLLLMGLLFALSAVGVDLTALSVLGGAVGVGLGFGLQKLASNYVSGFVILFERSVRIGDTIKVDTFEGTVVDIKTRYTLLRGTNGRESIVPNEKLITERIENLSLADPKLLVTTTVTVGYDSDVDKVEAILIDAALASSRVLKDPGPGARLANLGADGLEYQLLFWIADPENGQLNVRSEINVRILKALVASGIDIPYQQRVVHVKTLPVDPAGAATIGTTTPTASTAPTASATAATD